MIVATVKRAVPDVESASGLLLPALSPTAVVAMILEQ